MHILVHLGGQAASGHIARRPGTAAQGGRFRGCRSQLDVTVLDVGADGLGFKLRDIEGIDGDMSVIHHFLGAQGIAVEVFAALVDADVLVAPVGEDVVAGNPYQAFMAGEGGEMARHGDQNDQRGAGRIASHIEQLGINGTVAGRRIGAISVHRVQVGDAVHLVESLAVAGFFLLRLGDGLGTGRKFLQARHQSGVIGCDLLQDTEAEAGHGVDAYPLRGRQGGQELEHLLAGVVQVSPGNVALIDEQNRAAGLGCRRCGGCGG